MFKRLNLFRIAALCCLGLLFVFCGCQPDPVDNGDVPLVFTSLSCARDTIFTEDTTAIRATASGFDIEYHWFVEKGDLLGSGKEITFLATPCTVGENVITCTVWDGYGQHIEKNVVVVVL